MSQTILVVEDDPGIRELLSFTLHRASFVITAVETAEEALQSIDHSVPELAIIDWMLPGMDGIDLVNRLRKDPLTTHIPMIMLTALGEETDKLKGFEVGADDYITKPFSPRELIARVKALLRRSGIPADNTLELGELRLDLSAHRLSISGQRVHIGPTEFRLLELLLRNPERVFERSQLLDRVWGRSVYVEERTVDVHILRLRKLLQPFHLDNLIQTVRGVGYRLSPH